MTWAFNSALLSYLDVVPTLALQGAVCLVVIKIEGLHFHQRPKSIHTSLPKHSAMPDLRLCLPSLMLPFQSFCLSFSALIVNCRGVICRWHFRISHLCVTWRETDHHSLVLDASPMDSGTNKSVHMQLGVQQAASDAVDGRGA